MSAFETSVTIRFRHCDPAGIVFYPRYFEILNDVVEDWFAAMGRGFADMMGASGVAVPLAAIEAEFLAPSRLGDLLRAVIDVRTIGRTSCALAVDLYGEDGATRVRFRPTIVCVRRETLRPEPWSEALRAAMTGGVAASCRAGLNPPRPAG